MTLYPGDTIFAAFAEPACGPGWSNRPLYVVIMDGDKHLRWDCFQPEEFNAEIQNLYPFSALAHGQMSAAVRRLIAEEGGGSR